MLDAQASNRLTYFLWVCRRLPTCHRCPKQVSHVVILIPYNATMHAFPYALVVTCFLCTHGAINTWWAWIWKTCRHTTICTNVQQNGAVRINALSTNVNAMATFMVPPQLFIDAWRSKTESTRLHKISVLSMTGNKCMQSSCKATNYIMVSPISGHSFLPFVYTQSTSLLKSLKFSSVKNKQNWFYGMSVMLKCYATFTNSTCGKPTPIL